MALCLVAGSAEATTAFSSSTALVNAEKAPKQSQITKLQTSTTTQLSAVGTVKAALESYRTA
ncbi:hypothetical protein BZ163_03840, partial [Pseudomonas sp. VI4.1]